MPIREDEWKREIERVMGKTGDDGKTLRELSAQLGLSERMTRERIRLLHLAGRMGVGRRPAVTIDGRPNTVPVYWILPAKARP